MDIYIIDILKDKDNDMVNIRFPATPKLAQLFQKIFKKFHHIPEINRIDVIGDDICASIRFTKNGMHIEIIEETARRQRKKQRDHKYRSRSAYHKPPSETWG